MIRSAKKGTVTLKSGVTVLWEVDFNHTHSIITGDVELDRIPDVILSFPESCSESTTESLSLMPHGLLKWHDSLWEKYARMKQ